MLLSVPPVAASSIPGVLRITLPEPTMTRIPKPVRETKLDIDSNFQGTHGLGISTTTPKRDVRQLDEADELLAMTSKDAIDDAWLNRLYRDDRRYGANMLTSLSSPLAFRLAAVTSVLGAAGLLDPANATARRDAPSAVRFVYAPAGQFDTYKSFAFDPKKFTPAQRQAIDAVRELVADAPQLAAN